MLLHYRAGPRALRTLRDKGLSAHSLRALIAPAAGPKWLAVAGLDRALLQSGLLSASPILLGASAGAWRSMALCARDPQATHQRLATHYIGQRFERGVHARQVTAAYRTLLQEVFPEADVAHALAAGGPRLALLAARTRGTVGSYQRRLQALSLGVAALCNGISARSSRLFFERTLFHTPQTPGTATSDALWETLQGRRVALSADNARDALLASGTVPLYMEPVPDIAGSGGGRYMDGGLTDYHLNQPLSTDGDGVLLFLLHQRRIIPNWFDKYAPHHRPPRSHLQDLLLVHPSQAWVASLPGGHVPTREDFTTFVDTPDERMTRWHDAVARTEQLAEQFLGDWRSGALVDRLKPL